MGDEGCGEEGGEGVARFEEEGVDGLGEVWGVERG